MNIKYRGGIYKVSFHNFFIYNWYRIILFSKRIKRMINRVLFNNKEIYVAPLILMFLITGFVSLLCLFGIYENFGIALLDFKDSIVVSIFGSIVYGWYTTFDKWKTTISKQYDIYYSLMCDCEWFFNEFLSNYNYMIENNKPYIFIDASISDNLIISKQNIKKKIDYKKIEYNNKKFIELLNMYKKDLLGISAIDYSSFSYSSDLRDFEDLVTFNERKMNIQIIVSIKDILYSLIKQTRWPWRWDYNIDKKIRKLLSEESTFLGSSNDFNSLDYYEGEKFGPEYILY